MEVETMAMEPFQNLYKVDLRGGTAPVVPLKQIYFGDENAQRVGAVVFNGLQPVSLSGTCSGTAILRDGTTVPLTGHISGNTAYVDLVEECYAVEGIIRVFVKIVTGSIKATLLTAVGTVAITETDIVIDPDDTIIPSVAALIAEIQDAVASIPADYSALLAAIAPNYSDLTFPVAAGTYCWYSGTLYRAKQDISTSESWTAAHWEAAVIGNDLAGKAGKADFEQLKAGFNAALCPLSFSPTITKGEFISPTTGIKGSNAKNARIGLWNGYSYRIAVLLDSAVYEYRVHYFSAAGNITDGTGYLGCSDYASGLQYIPSQAILFGLTFRRVDKADLTDADVTAISAALSAYAATDTSLSNRGLAADAKTTGDRIHGIEDSAAYGGATEKTVSLNGGIVYGNFGINTGMSYTSAAYRRSANPIPIPEGAASVTVKATGSYEVWIGKFSATPSFENETSNSSIYLGGIGKSTTSIMFVPEAGVYYYLSYSSDSSDTSLIPKITWQNALDAKLVDVSASLASNATGVEQLQIGFDAALCPASWSPSITIGQYINSVSGATCTNAKNARTTYLNPGYPQKTGIRMNNSAYRFRVHYYSAGDTPNTDNYVGTSPTIDAGVIYLPSEAVKFGITFVRVDLADMTSADVTAIQAALSIYRPTDTALTAEGKSADAKATGDRIHGIEDSAAYGGETEKLITLSGGIVYGNFGINTGMSYTSAAYRRSANPIPIPEGAVSVTVKTTGTYDVWVSKFSATPSFENEANNSSIYLGGVGKSTNRVTFTPESGVYYYVSYSSSSSATNLIPKITWNNALDEKITELSASQSTALSMFTSIGVCGASWDSGYIYPYGQSSPIEKSELSWGANVARRNGIPTYGCYAYHGVYTKTWLENANCLAALLAADPHQLYVINLLGNDSTHGTEYLGSIADITSYESYEDYADSYYGNYGRIIEQIEAHAPNALIILIGGAYAGSSANRRAYLAAMQEIASYYNLPAINWYDDPWYGTNNPDFAIGISGDHPTAPLLAGMGQCFERLFADCYLKYPNYFNKFAGS